MTPAQEYVTRCAAMSVDELKAEHNRLLNLMIIERNAILRGRHAAYLIAIRQRRQQTIPRHLGAAAEGCVMGVLTKTRAPAQRRFGYQGFRYFAMYRHIELDTATQIAVSQDKKHIVMLTRKTKAGKDLATIESRPLYGVALVKVPLWMALDRELDFERQKLGERPWHKKDMRTYTPEENADYREYYEFADTELLAHQKNDGSLDISSKQTAFESWMNG